MALLAEGANRFLLGLLPKGISPLDCLFAGTTPSARKQIEGAITYATPIASNTVPVC